MFLLFSTPPLNRFFLILSSLRHPQKFLAAPPGKAQSFGGASPRPPNKKKWLVPQGKIKVLGVPPSGGVASPRHPHNFLGQQEVLGCMPRAPPKLFIPGKKVSTVLSFKFNFALELELIFLELFRSNPLKPFLR